MSVPNTHFGAEKIKELLAGAKSIFFVGIGGINMSSLAEISHRRGFLVGGSDRACSHITRRLEEIGINIEYSHSSENIDGYDALVFTVAISPDNPEYVRARERGIPCISRADYMGYIMTDKPHRIGISGMHGKSSCTSMFASVFMGAGVCPTVLSGAELDIMGGAYTVGDGDSFIFEACEYMDSFLDFNPSIAVILNIELDHVDYFSSLEQIRASFARFADITGECGYAVINADDENVLLATKDYAGKKISFGIKSEWADYRAVNIVSDEGRYSFDVLFEGDTLCRVGLSVTGEHNVYNALACVAASHLVGISPEDIVSGLCSYRGAARRMEARGYVGGARIYDDYAHHPTEIATTLRGAREMAGGRLICVYQPHTYSRTAALFDEFAVAFDFADRVILEDIYAARETDDGRVSSKKLARAIGERAVYGGSHERVAELLMSEIKEGDTVVVMGAGDTHTLFERLPIEKI